MRQSASACTRGLEFGRAVRRPQTHVAGNVNSPYKEIIAALLLVFAAYWGLTATAVKHPKRAEPSASSLLHTVLLLIGFALIWVKGLRFGLLGARFVPETVAPQVVGVALVAAGVGFAVWARRVLAADWSHTVTIKVQHRLVQSGPYTIVRNPIYTGVAVAVLGMALALGEIRGLLGLAFVVAAVWHKGWIEERFLLEEFGGDYAEYQRKVRFMIPFVL